MTEAHHHCQCDVCSGIDCGQGDPEKYAAEQKAQREEHDAAIRKDERERILDLVDDAISEKSWEIDTHSDDGFQRIVYCSEVDKIIGSFRTPDLKEENKPGCFGAIGLPGKRNDPGCPCAWQERCRQSQEDE